MPQRDVTAYLEEIRDAIAAIQVSVAGLDLDTYCAVRQIRSSVEREFTIIGEALRQALSVEPALRARIPAAPEIISFRNHLAHAYFAISDVTVWGIIHSHLPRLQADVERLLSERLPSP